MNDIEKLDWNDAARLINQSNSILLITHRKPDGDAIGSLIGLGLALKKYGKNITMAVDDGTPEKFNFLEGTELVKDAVEKKDFELVIALDGSDLEVLGKCGEDAFSLDVPKIVIDHHSTNELFGTYHLVSSDFVSTSESVLTLLEKLSLSLNDAIANALMLGILTDTQAFRYGPISAQTFRTAQKLMEYEVDMRGIIERTLISISHNQLKMIGLGLSKAQLENHVIWSWITPEELAAHGLDTSQRAALADELIKDEEAYISAFFRQTEDGDVRVSIRAIPGFDIGKIVIQFGGGGHKLAGGCALRQMGVKEAIEKVIPLLKEETHRGHPLYA